MHLSVSVYYNIFYTTLTLKTAAFVTCWAVKKWGNARPYTKSRKKSEEALKNIKKTILVRLRLFEKGKKRLFFGRLWNAGIKWKWSTATKVRSYSDNGTLSPLVHCSTDRWTIAYGTQLHDVQCLKMFLIIVSLQSGMEDSIIIILITAPLTLKNLNNRRGFAPGPPRRHPPVLPPPSRRPPHAGNNSLKPPISMTSSNKIVYAPRDQSGHANSRKVRSTWSKVIATESYFAPTATDSHSRARRLAITFGLVQGTWRVLRIPSLSSLHA